MAEVLLKIENNVAVVTMNRPETYNAITTQLSEQLKETFNELAGNDAIRVVVLTGAGKGFCSGADLKVIEGQDLSDLEVGRNFMVDVQALSKIIYHFPVPVIAGVNGACVGGGFGLALSCDYMISAESATYSMIFPNVGLVPDLGSMYTLPEKIGLPQAKRLMYTAKMLSAKEAYEYGIVEHVVSDDKLIDTCLEEAVTIANLAPRSMRYAKQTLNDVANMSFESLLTTESYQQAALFQTEDFAEAVAAFNEKRRPKFTDK